MRVASLCLKNLAMYIRPLFWTGQINGKRTLCTYDSNKNILNLPLSKLRILVYNKIFRNVLVESHHHQLLIEANMLTIHTSGSICSKYSISLFFFFLFWGRCTHKKTKLKSINFFTKAKKSKNIFSWSTVGEKENDGIVGSDRRTN